MYFIFLCKIHELSVCTNTRLCFKVDIDFLYSYRNLKKSVREIQNSCIYY